jgi:hypothetical protein
LVAADVFGDMVSWYRSETIFGDNLEGHEAFSFSFVFVEDKGGDE